MKQPVRRIMTSTSNMKAVEETFLDYTEKVTHRQPRLQVSHHNRRYIG
jgi:hypothetical protein